MLWGWSSRETSEGRGTPATRGPFRFWPSAVTVTVGSICLLAVPSVATWAIPAFKNVVTRLHGDVLNARDMAQQRRGYYEELDVGGMDNWRADNAEEPEGWSKGRKVFYRQRSDFLLTDITPSVSTFLGGPIESNSLGMRDREYDIIKPPNTYRIVLLGASHDQGSGVKVDETYENVVEDRLNHELPDSHYSRYEILNMSVGQCGLFQRLLRLEEQGFQFKPDAVILSVAALDKQFLFRHLSRALSLGIEPPPDYRQILEQVTRSAGIHGRMPEVMIERRLQPYGDELYEWAFQRFAQQCKQRGIHPLVVFRPAPSDSEGSEQAERTKVTGLARAAGLEVIDLSQAFDSVANRNTLVVAKWDHHTTALGHRLLADKLYEGLVPLLFGSSH